VAEGEHVYDGSVYDPITRDRAEAVFAAGEPGEIGHALLRLALAGADGEYAERRALEHVHHPDVWVRRNAATALGHLARIHGGVALDRTLPALLALMADPEVFGYADDALRDVEHFLGVNRGAWMNDPRLCAVGYSDFDEVAEVQMTDGSVFQHAGVDPAAWRGMWTTRDPEKPDLLSRLGPYPRRKLRRPRITRRSEWKAE
jgi:HEAT repeat protein